MGKHHPYYDILLTDIWPHFNIQWYIICVHRGTCFQWNICYVQWLFSINNWTKNVHHCGWLSHMYCCTLLLLLHILGRLHFYSRCYVWSGLWSDLFRLVYPCHQVVAGEEGFANRTCDFRCWYWHVWLQVIMWRVISAGYILAHNSHIFSSLTFSFVVLLYLFLWCLYLHQ